jgi:hypothetical protein
MHVSQWLVWYKCCDDQLLYPHVLLMDELCQTFGPAHAHQHAASPDACRLSAPSGRSRPKSTPRHGVCLCLTHQSSCACRSKTRAQFQQHQPMPACSFLNASVIRCSQTAQGAPTSQPSQAGRQSCHAVPVRYVLCSLRQLPSLGLRRAMACTPRNHSKSKQSKEKQSRTQHSRAQHSTAKHCTATRSCPKF